MDVQSADKICKECTRTIKKGESYFAFAENATGDHVDLLTASHTWTFAHHDCGSEPVYAEMTAGLKGTSKVN